MKKKTQLVSLLDDLRNQDPKTRLSSLQSLKEIAAGLGPVRTRTQFLQYLQEFVDDEEEVVDELLSQLSDFRAELGGEEHEKQLLSLLVCFCKTDQFKQTEKALSLMEPILAKNKDLILDVIKKLSKTQMNTSKHSAAYLTSRLIHLVPQQQNQLLQIFSGMIFSDVPAYKIIASKFLYQVLEKVKNKEEVGKMFEVIYSDNDDLPKIFAMQALVSYYPVNSNFVAGKFKLMLGMNNWRLNAKVCEVVTQCGKVFTKASFKATFQHPILKFLTSTEPQLRAKACSLLKSLALGMAEEEMKKNLIPVIKKLASDPVNYVKVAAAQNIVPLVEVMPGSLINEELLPIIFIFIKINDLAVGILKNFESLTKKFSSEMIEQKILTPLVSQLNTDDWKAKCLLIDLLTGVISNSFFLNDQLTTTLVHLAEDKIGAVREKATQLIINIISQQSPQWCDSMLIPKIQCLKQSSSYVERQIMLQIIEVIFDQFKKTWEKVSQKTLSDVYRQTVLKNLADKVPNVRAKALKVLKNSKAINDKMFDKYVQKLKGDSDSQVRRLAGEMGKFSA